MTDKQSIALKINDWLNDCVAESGAFFLNTVEAGRPKSRPISFHMLKDGVNYFGVGAMKEVYRQISVIAAKLFLKKAMNCPKKRWHSLAIQS